MGTKSRITRGSLLIVSGSLLLAWMASAPLTTRQGVDFRVQTHPIPLYLKAVSFLDRHWQYQQQARDITRGLVSDQERVLAVFAWTRAHILPTPPAFPIVDDHILHIMIRGYGEPDQMADVFTTLSTYAGVSAFWRPVKAAGGSQRLILSFARVDGRWGVFDVAGGVVFRDAQGRLTDMQELMARPALARESAGVTVPSGIPYERYVEGMRVFNVPTMLRAKKQMPWPRLAFELQRALRLKGGDSLDEQADGR